MSLLAMNSLYEKMGNDGYLWSKHKRLKPCATRTIIFQRKLKLFNSLYRSVYLVLSTLFVFYCQYVQPCVICGKQCNETSRQVTTGGPNVQRKTRFCKTKSLLKAVTLVRQLTDCVNFQLKCDKFA